MTLRDFVQQPSIQALAWALVHFLWQGALLGIAAFVALRVARPARAAVRYAIGVATLALMLVTCVATFTILSRQASAIANDPIVTAEFTGNAASAAPATREGTAGGAAAPRAGLAAAMTSYRIGPRTLFAIVTMWAAGVLALSFRLIGGWMLTRRLATRAIAAVPSSLEAAALEIARRLRIRRAVAILESGAVSVPTVVGWVKPVVLLPAAALSGLSPEQLQAILAHELAHVRRHDYLVNLLQSMIETLLFYHPATWWVSAQVRAEREHCCDDLAVEVCGDRLVYVSALAEMTTLAGHRGFALAATDGSLVTRVQRILGRPRSVHEPAPAWPVLALVVLIAGSAGSFGAAADAPERAVVRPAQVDRTPQIESGAVSSIAAPQRATESTPSDTTQDWGPASAYARESSGKLRRDLAEAAVGREGGPPQDLGSNGSGNISWSDNGEKFSLRWTGEFRLTEDEKDIAWIEEGATVTITDGRVFTDSVQLRGLGGGRIERRFTKTGFRREYEPEGRLLVAAALDKLIRSSGAFARQRVARFLKQGGPEAVLAEIERLSDSSYVRRVYYGELLKQAPITEPLLARVLQRVPNDLRSDYDKATLLTQAAQLPAMTDAHRVAIARAVRSINSDYDQRRTLTALLTTTPVAPAVAAAVVEATSSIGSSYDRSLVLMEVAERGGLTCATSTAFMGQVGSMSSSYDQRRVLTAVSKHGSLPEGVAVDAVRTVGSMGSSYDQSVTLINLIERGGLTDASAAAFFESAARIPSSYDLSRVLRAPLDQPQVSDRVVEGVLRVVPKVGSSHDRANVLLEVVKRARLTGTARQLFIVATDNMGSHDENRVLAALVRAEGRQ